MFLSFYFSIDKLSLTSSIQSKESTLSKPAQLGEFGSLV